MALNLPNFQKLDAADMGGFDLANALRSGFKTYSDFHEAKMKPKTLSEALLAQQLSNKINTAKAKYAEQNEQAGLQLRQGNLGLLPYRQKLLEAQAQAAGYGAEAAGRSNDFDKAMFDAYQSGSTPKSTTDEPLQMPSDEGRDFSNLNKPKLPANTQVVNEGNANLSSFDELYDSSPYAKKMLEAKGYKKTQQTKYDPKTGVSTVITTYPSGKVTVSNAGGEPGGIAIPLTNAMKTQQQNIITNVPKVNRMIDSLVSKRSPMRFSPDRAGAAVHNALVKEAAETYAKAKGWPNTNESIKAAAEILDRGNFESDVDYRKRLKELKKELDRNTVEAQSTLYPNRKTAASDVGAIEYIRDASGRLVPQ